MTGIRTRVNGGDKGRSNSTEPALEIRQDGTGKILSLKDGATEVFAVADGGAITASAGTGSGMSGIGGVLTVSTTQTQTGANTTETDLWTYSLPASTLSTNGYGVRVTAFGTVGANGNTKVARIYFGSTAVVVRSTSLNGTGWWGQALVLRTGASAQLAIGPELAGGGGAGNSPLLTTPSEDTTGAITIKVTGQNGTASAGDVVFRGAVVEFLRPGA